ncbi:ribosomal protein L29 [Actinoplanes campanulatus]|uniref:Ribosomal protein L29 n=1 Tax=Actinoplanes campanulatus TaxID=113559 RepID=A0A7W5ADV6_9ACTN|nr:hypothetical protein [Actinoplanes campanulatus]MBB3094501.1 ribosomal protein L29 [Actinoplanes campanulatus]GGN21497.1 hypothetical protein GCM10010109_35660 [Actinoplanes campanulatus]GID35584.1 hypothetical protein Aca09nite_20900 [Actinoplanes campanulatus]
MTIPPSESPPTGSPDGTGPEDERVEETAPVGVPGSEEIERLRAEVAALRAQLEGERRRRPSRGGAIRRGVAAVLAVVAAFALVTSVVGLWAATTTLNTDRWVATVAPLPQDPKVNAAVAEYSTTEVFRVLDVEQRLRTVLPEQAAFVAGPLTAQIREQVRKTVQNVLGSDRFQVIWVELNRQLHQKVVDVVEGESNVVTAREDSVQIDLLPLINQVLRQLSDQLPTLFGKEITLPDLSSGAIPENLRLRVEEALGVTLPADFATFTVYDSGQLWEVQQAVASAKRYLALFVAGTILLLLAAFVVSPQRRRTAVQFGLWLVVAAVTVTVVLRAVRREILEAMPAGVYHDGVDAAMTTVFRLLRERDVQLIVIGSAIALLAYLAGPGRFPVWLRHSAARWTAAGWRRVRAGSVVVAARGPGFIARNLDPVRVGGLVVAILLALVLSSWTSLLVIVVLLVAYEVAVTLIAHRHTEAERTPPPALG